MSDDERKRRRLGDETKARIADLASGWDTPSAAGVAPDPAPKSAPPAAAPRRAQPKTQPPPPPSAPAHRNLDDVLLDMSEDLDSVDLEPDDWAAGEGAAGAEQSGARARHPASTRSAPTESGAVDVSGLISDQTPPLEPIVPVPTVDASALGGAVITSEPMAPRSAVSDRSGGLGAPPRGPLGSAKGQGPAVPPPAPARGEPRTSPPPPRGARATGGAAAIPGGGGTAGTRPGASGALPASGAAGASGGTAGARPGASGADADSSDSDLSFDDLAKDATASPRSGATAVIADDDDDDDSSDSGPRFTGLTSSAMAGSRGGASASSSAGIPRSGLHGAGSGGVSSISGRLPLPADPDALPAARPRSASTPYPGSPRAGRNLYFGDDSGSETVPEAGASRARPSPPLAVPVGEFDASQPEPMVRREPTSGLLELADRAGVADHAGAPQPPPRAPSSGVLLVAAGAQDARDDVTTIDPAARRFDRGDPTLGSDPTVVRAPGRGGAVTPKARLRTIAQLRRTGGVGGDMRYVLTVIFGLRRARRELGALETQEAALQQSRRRHLVTLGRTASTAEGFAHPALARAGEQLGAIEEERAQHTAQVAAADGELQRVNQGRAAQARQHAAELEEIDGELAELQKQLEPLEKELAGVTRRAAALRDAMRRMDEKLALTEARLAGADVQEEDRGAIQAELASLRADRKSVQKDEPVLASSLDSLQPRIAKLEAARADARRRRLDAEQAERDDQRRTEELLAAIGAKRKVLDRAASDAEAKRDKIMFELGERLYVERPASMGPELAPIDAIDVELGTVDRRTMELREILQSVDRMKLARSIALWILLLAAIGLGVYAALQLG